MANTSPSLLALANTTNSNLNLQIPSINIKLERDNYSLWRSTIISALETFELESFILNPAPPMQTHIINTSDGVSSTEPNPDFVLWKKRDRFKKALSLVVRATSSHMAWTAIEKTFQAQTRARRMAMKVQLQTLTKRSLSMLEYIERKRFIADSLAENLHPISDEDLIGYILSSLDSSYSAFSTAFIMKSDDVSVDDLVGLLLQEEARLEQEHVHQAVVVSQPTNPTPLLSTSVVYTTNRFSNRSSSTNNPNNNSGSFPRRNVDNPRRRPICQLCSKPGHETIDYWQRTNQTN
uniref:Retrotransposon Copia-like N-terminal domain-containing protein n=1 Tax=Glycine max TaxID=3847 RepID=A0A0R0GVF3_SOYBN